MGLLTRWWRAALLLVVLALVAMPASAAETRETDAGLLSHLSQVVQFRYLTTHPNEAPSGLARIAQTAARLRSGQTQAGTSAAAGGLSGLLGDRFNRDDVGLPQNEEAVTVCRNDPQVVLEGANDYRGLLDPAGNFTGWYFSTDGGKTLKNEGLLPPVPNQGVQSPSGGDPVMQSDDDCNLFSVDLNYPAVNAFNGPNGIGLYKTTPQRLASCPQGEDPTHLTHPSCWPQRRIAAQAKAVGGVGHFLDKPWMDVGTSGSAGEVVWIVYSDFNITPEAPVGFTGAQIKAVRCTADLDSCTDPILISGTDQDIQFGDVTIAQDGSTLITWAQIKGELEQTAQTFVIKARIAPPGSTTFGRTRVVATESNPLPFGGFLHAEDFRTSTYPKSIMPIVGGKLRPFVVWDRCRYRLLDNICEEPQIVMSWSNDEGVTWSDPKVISTAGDNWFPAISDEVGSSKFVVAYHTTRFDPLFHNRYDVEMVTISNASHDVVHRQRVTAVSNEPEADPILGGFFIGDYFDVHLLRGNAYVGYNANYRHERLLGQGIPVPQQDNYLTKLGA